MSGLEKQLLTYLDGDQVSQVRAAYQLAKLAHDGQMRRSGEPYISHPVAVARILAGMRMDHQSIMAALLHDVIEDTDYTAEDLSEKFGSDVSELVEGVTKLTQIKFENRTIAQAENFRKMVLAMAKDIRVILVKLADRLHNMRTLGHLAPEKRRRIATETLEIYAPVANRLGMNTIRIELEDLGFAAMYPYRAKVLRESVRKARGNRTEIISTIESAVLECLEREEIGCKVYGREKHLYSLYRKLRAKKEDPGIRARTLHEITDVYAFRVVVDKVDTCYRVLGAVHNLYKPRPGAFKDYIAIPKANGYQSIHTVLVGPYGVPVEIQIRTEDMDRMANNGIAAHFLYKSDDDGSGRSNAQQRARKWIRGLLEMQQQAGNSLEFIDNVKVDLFPDEVYVFTPKGKIMEMPRGATVVDMAYGIHTDLGNRCIAGKVDRRLVPLSTQLNNGQTVEIITAPAARPNPAWLNFVVTGKARASIRHHLKTQRRSQSISLGNRLLDKELVSSGFSTTQLDDDQRKKLLEHLGTENWDDLLEDIGLGNRMAPLVAQVLISEEQQSSNLDENPLAIKGTEGLVIKYGRCCRPIPGDPIVGYLSAGKGLVVHVNNCNNVSDRENHPHKILPMQWDDEVVGEFLAELRVEVTNQRGVLARLAMTVADCDANIENITTEDRDGLISVVSFTVAVKGRVHLARVIRKLRHVEGTARIVRGHNL
ncbi:bifunctional GTP diphosphokinase/guanosine-3',5'-bis pyrophosphate 3'-pyrophosphohydrolase [Pelagibaculum spongiae]|uniref:guanosine-3',5'-bis(diphosphate) 3'-diphosphatase n=1 Tax=Pelagibaculum spongiae TaxID=2080658 RepID=A0A2V1GT35_9GAMM|nr:bifunctional GTP diphosphokinase/guanosine-3',5'-bis pyrophosphate 3'-pyrophosphohydrolase [Pelagibaculum spongiae]PVZ68452.1 guanosine-3',5'-bis(diphosphate) 3'-diphosphatase [Pelagibaculum spongiae]